jgi:hypothetical protein
MNPLTNNKFPISSAHFDVKSVSMFSNLSLSRLAAWQVFVILDGKALCLTAAKLVKY